MLSRSVKRPNFHLGGEGALSPLFHIKLFNMSSIMSRWKDVKKLLKQKKIHDIFFRIRIVEYKKKG